MTAEKTKKVHHKPRPPKNPEMAQKLGAVVEDLDLAGDLPPTALVTPEDHRAAQIAHAAACGDLEPSKAAVTATPASPWKKHQEKDRPRYTEEQKAIFNLRRRIQAVEEENRKLNKEIDELVNTCQAALDEASAREAKMVELMEGMQQVARENLARPTPKVQVDLTELKAELRQELLASLQGDLMGVLEEVAASALSEVAPAQASAPAETGAVSLTPEELLANYKARTPFYKRPSVQGAVVGTAAGCAAAYGLKRLVDSLDSHEC